MKIPITIIFDIVIGGNPKTPLDNEETSRLLYENVIRDADLTIFSEDIDGTKDYAILIKSIKRKLEENDNAL